MHHVYQSLLVLSLVLPGLARGEDPEKSCPKKNCPLAAAAEDECCKQACKKQCDQKQCDQKITLTAATEDAPCAKACAKACAKGECTKTASAKGQCAKGACDKTAEGGSRKKRVISVVMWMTGIGGEPATLAVGECEAKTCAKSQCETKTACAKGACESKVACAKGACESKVACAKSQFGKAEGACPLACAKQAVAAKECSGCETRVAPAVSFLAEGCPLSCKAGSEAAVARCSTGCDKLAAGSCATACDKSACAVATDLDCGCPEKKLEHLMAACEHLAAAGLTAEALKVSEMARDVRRDLLRIKLDQLAELRNQVERLQEEAIFEPAETASTPSELPK